jgi:hypothetical protein
VCDGAYIGAQIDTCRGRIVCAYVGAGRIVCADIGAQTGWGGSEKLAVADGVEVGNGVRVRVKEVERGTGGHLVRGFRPAPSDSASSDNPGCESAFERAT